MRRAADPGYLVDFLGVFDAATATLIPLINWVSDRPLDYYLNTPTIELQASNVFLSATNPLGSSACATMEDEFKGLDQSDRLNELWEQLQNAQEVS